MTLHKPSGRWKLGLALALFTVFCWGGLPIVIKVVLRDIDAVTLSWFRFLVAALFMLGYLAAQRKIPNLRSTTGRTKGLLFAAGLGLGLNYVLFQAALQHIGPSAAQIVIQVSPVMFILGSVLIFRESFSRLQRVGLGIMTAGYTLFFAERYVHAEAAGPGYALGVVLVLSAGVGWAAYAMAQKQLLTTFDSKQIMTFVYTACAIALTPLAAPSKMLGLEPVILWLVIAAAANTIVAYGAFAESLAHWEGSRVSAVIALTPVMTLSLAELGSYLWPERLPSEQLAWWSYLGAALVVAGSMTTSLAKADKATA